MLKMEKRIKTTAQRAGYSLELPLLDLRMRIIKLKNPADSN